MIPPGTRGLPHLHGHETAGYVVSGEAEVWHGTGLIRRSVVRAGDFIYIPPGTPHLAVNRGDVTSIAVVARAGQQAAAASKSAARTLMTRKIRPASSRWSCPGTSPACSIYPVGYGG